MCGRFTLKTPVAEWLSDLFPSLDRNIVQDLVESLPKEMLRPRYNIAPTQNVVVLTFDAAFKLSPMRWGLIPSWSDSTTNGYSMINARVETVHEKRSFKSSLMDKRCVVLADGYYEWKKISTKIKEPYWIHRAMERPIAMAGLWAENLRVDPAKPIHSTTVVTTPANHDTESVHDRMPAIFHTGSQVLEWLTVKVDPQGSSSPFANLLNPNTCDSLLIRRIGSEVGAVKNDSESLIAEADSW